MWFMYAIILGFSFNVIKFALIVTSWGGNIYDAIY